MIRKIFCCLALGLLLTVAHAQDRLTRVVVANGGGTLSTSDNSMRLRFTVGQASADPKTLKGGEYRLQTGYWGPEADPDLVFRNSAE